MAKNEIYCDANLKLTPKLNVANNSSKCLISRDETINDLLSFGKLSHDMCDLGSFEANSSSVCTYTKAMEKSLHVISMTKSYLKKRFILT